MDPARTPDVSYLVTGGRVALQPGQERPAANVLSSCAVMAEVAAFDLGSVGFGSGGEQRPVAWTSRPDLTHLEVATADALAQSMMLELLGLAGEEAALPTRPFIPDMVERFESN